MSKLTIRNADLADVNLISTLAITTCYEAYFELDPSHDLANYCINFYSPTIIENELNDEKSTHIIAEINGKAVGFAKLREGKKIECLQDKNAIEIQRIYVLEKLKGQNIGKNLLEKCCEIGTEKGFETIWLGVWEKNVKAQKFYEKIGMKQIGITDFSDGKNEFINLVFAKNLGW
jgi:ribosomal protein S18 acetylase RimI-like enzyme